MNSEQRQYLDRLARQREAFERKTRAIVEAGNTRHSHADIDSWIRCFHCMQQRKNQLAERQKLRLLNRRKYHQWRKKNTTEYDWRTYVANEKIFKF